MRRYFLILTPYETLLYRRDPGLEFFEAGVWVPSTWQSDPDGLLDTVDAVEISEAEAKIWIVKETMNG